MSKFKGLSLDRYELKDFSEGEIRQRLVNVVSIIFTSLQIFLSFIQCETPYPQLYEQESMTPNTEQHKRGLCFDAWYISGLETGLKKVARPGPKRPGYFLGPPGPI